MYVLVLEEINIKLQLCVKTVEVNTKLRLVTFSLLLCQSQFNPYMTNVLVPSNVCHIVARHSVNSAV